MRCFVVRNFAFQILCAVQNKLGSKFCNIACCSIASARHSSACANGVRSNSVGMKPRAVDYPVAAQLSIFLYALCFLLAMLRFLAPKPKTDDRQGKISAKEPQSYCWSLL